MYCKNCGKQIDYEGELCRECLDAGVPDRPTFYAAQPPVTTTVPATPMTEAERNLLRAVLSTVMGCLAYLGMLIAFAFVLGRQDIYVILQKNSEWSKHMTGTLIILAVITAVAITLAVLSLVFGLKAIHRFFTAKKAGEVTERKTAVWGGVGVGASVLTLFLASIALILIFAFIIALCIV